MKLIPIAEARELLRQLHDQLVIREQVRSQLGFKVQIHTTKPQYTGNRIAKMQPPEKED